jgi:hypothetical protein
VCRQSPAAVGEAQSRAVRDAVSRPRPARAVVRSAGRARRRRRQLPLRERGCLMGAVWGIVPAQIADVAAVKHR